MNKNRSREQRREFYLKRKSKNYFNLRRQRIRLLALQHYGGNPPKCACCGETEIKFMSIDHIKGGGRKHKAKEYKHSNLAEWVTSNHYPKGFQILCYNCNCAKGFFGVCPHQN